MPESSSVAGHSLTDYLQQLTEQLAATHTQTDVLHATLQPAIAALSALSGAILLLDPKTTCLQMAARQGHDAQTIWQDGPLTPETPAGDALLHRQPLYFEHADTLKAAYPALETHTGTLTVVATALLPLVLEDQALGVLILDFTQPHTFAPDERRFLTTVAAQCSVALGRAQVITALQASETRFRRLVEVSPLAIGIGSLDGHLSLVNDAYLGLIGQTRAAFDAGQIDWQAITPPEYQAREAAAFEAALQTGASGLYQKELLTTEGERVPVEIMLVRYDEQQMAGYALDLRPQREQEQRLREEGARLEQLVADRTAELLNEQAASRAFIAFSQQTAQTTDVVLLAEQAIEVLRTVLGNVSVGYYELRDDLLRVQRWSADISPEFLTLMQAGFATDIPRFAKAFGTGQVVFVEGWNPALEQLPLTQGYTSVATYPFFVQGQPYSVLSIGRREQTWSERDQAVVQAVGQALGLALERTETARQLAEQQAAAQSRARALEAFEQLSRDLMRETDRYALIRRAQEIILSLLSSGYAVYCELEGDLWRSKAQTGDIKNAELQVIIETGFSRTLPTLFHPWNTGKDFYHDHYAQSMDMLPMEAIHQLQAVASLVLRLQGQPIGIFTLGLFEHRVWTTVDRVILNTAIQSLELALERAAAAEQVHLQRDEAERRSRALEAFEQLSRELVRETDRYTLIQRALEIIMSLLPPGFAIHYELEEGLWRIKAQTGDMGSAQLQRLASAGWPFEVPTLHTPWATGEDLYQDAYAQGSDSPIEAVAQVNTTATLVVRLQGQPIGFIVIGIFESRAWSAVDRTTLNTARQSLELALERAQGVQALAERTGELEQANQELLISNQELEAFTYSASHDLRTPVRHVLGFTELAETALEQNPEKARRHLKIVKEASHRMTALIDAMLILSRAGRSELKRQPIPLAKLVSQAQRDVVLEFPEQAVEWQLGTLPIVFGDPEMLQQVLTNLVSNAVKYGQGRDPLQVRLWAEERPGEVAILVQDTGVGFDPQYAERLFGAFQRLHRQQEFAGTGIGLATVKRIVTRHGGHVWAEGRLGEGATFGFSLPRQGGIHLG